MKKVAIGVAIGGTVGIAAPLAIGAGLATAGFGAGGVAAGSLAAAWQSAIGSVAAGSLFASKLISFETLSKGPFFKNVKMVFFLLLFEIYFYQKVYYLDLELKRNFQKIDNVCYL